MIDRIEKEIKLLKSMTGSADYEGYKDQDLVIEVLEEVKDMAIKKALYIIEDLQEENRRIDRKLIRLLTLIKKNRKK